MGQELDNERNSVVDVIRGIAILLVVLGHTMTGCTTESQNSFLFNVIWSLQMPLFYLVSGYVTKYSKIVIDRKSLLRYIMKRTIGYMLPWLVWTFIIRGAILGQHLFFNIKYFAFHMDTGYWFLFSLWTICIVHGLASFISEKITNNDKAKVVVISVCYILVMVLLVGIAVAFGFSFLCIKLTLYYIPFFYLGFLFGRYQKNIFISNNAMNLVEICTAMMLVIYFYLLSRFNLYEMSEGIKEIAIRAIASLFGCAAICAIIANLYSSKSKVSIFLQYVGKHSLEIYLIHYLLLSIISTNPLPIFSTLQGVTLCIWNFSLTLTLTLLVTALLNGNKYTRIIGFGKLDFK